MKPEDLLKINVYKSQFKSLRLSLSNLKKSFIKLITNALNDKIWFHYIGEMSGKIQGFSVAVVNGLTKAT